MDIPRLSKFSDIQHATDGTCQPLAFGIGSVKHVVGLVYIKQMI